MVKFSLVPQPHNCYLEHSHNPQSDDDAKFTALHMAACSGSVQICQMLLDGAGVRAG